MDLNLIPPSGTTIRERGERYQRAVERSHRKLRLEQQAMHSFWVEVDRGSQRLWANLQRRTARLRADNGLATCEEMRALLRRRFPGCQVWLMEGVQPKTWQLSFMGRNWSGRYRHWEVVASRSTLKTLSALILRWAYPRGWH